MERLIDLRSDTVTKPSDGMRRAMASAEVGDDDYGDDPTVRRLEERAAELSGKEAALLMVSGTMANQVAIGCLTRPGEEVLVGRQVNMSLYEAGAGAKINGVQFEAIGQRGLFSAADVRAAYKPDDTNYYPPTALVAVENTHNRGGGLVWAPQDIEAVARQARELGLKLHLDGARIFNAQVKTGVTVAAWSASFDTLSFCLSKGLGAPFGSMLCSTKQVIQRARRLRKAQGGGMRQAGILAAAGLYALDNNVERLAEDHANVALLADRLASLEGIELDPGVVQTNILIFGLASTAVDAPTFVRRAKARGVLLNALAERQVRAVTHLDVSRQDIDEASRRLAEVLISK